MLGPPPYHLDNRYLWHEGDWIGRRTTFARWRVGRDASLSLERQAQIIEDCEAWEKD
jgi:hypothetical protein